MACSRILAVSVCAILALMVMSSLEVAEARYLPTRAKVDRLDKLRELLKELLESEIEKEEYQSQDAPPRWHPEQKLFYKREIQQ